MRRVVNLVLVRHGETVDNVRRVIQGHSNVPLSENGRKQAEILGHHLADEVFTRVFSSDLSRAFETARIALSLSRTSPPDIVQDKGLRERSYGEMEGHHVDPFIAEAKRLGVPTHQLTPAGAETWEQVEERVKRFLEVVYDLSDGERDDAVVEENVLVLTHGGWLKILLVHLSSNPERFTLSNFDHSKRLIISGNTGVTRIQLEPLLPNSPRSLVFLSLHDVSHLLKSPELKKSIERRAADDQVPPLHTMVNDGV